MIAKLMQSHLVHQVYGALWSFMGFFWGGTSIVDEFINYSYNML
jgi:hypothetical protein